MDVTLLGMVMEVKPVQPENAEPPMDVTLLGMVKVVKPIQLLNAELPMDVTLLGMVMEVKPVQPENAELLMDVTLLGMVIDVKPVQSWNAALPIVVTLLGISIDIMFIQLEKARSAIPTVSSLRCIAEPTGIDPLYVYATLPAYTTPSDWLFNHAVPEKAPLPIDVTLLGIVTDVRPKQP